MNCCNEFIAMTIDRKDAESLRESWVVAAGERLSRGGEVPVDSPT